MGELARTDNPFRMPPDMDFVYKPVDQKKTQMLYQRLAQTGRGKIDFLGRVVRGKRFCLASFPGSYQNEWEAYAQKCGGTWGSVACVFLSGKDFGEHSKNPEDGKRCYCHAMYGKEEAFGCQWFEKWAANVEDAVEDGQRLLVYFERGQKGNGIAEWSELASDPSPSVGLGTSQKAEVAWLKKKGYRFECCDMANWEHYTDDLAWQERPKSIWEKPTAASRYMGTKTLRDDELPMAAVPPALQKELDDARSKALAFHTPDREFLTTIATKPAVGVVEPLRKEERDLRTYVKKKREVFLVQMALDVKKTEITRIDQQARLKEEALAKSQQMLEDDRKNFEDFLQERYAKQQQTQREAENGTKQKQLKIQEIKQIRQQIASLQSEIGRFKEVRDECMRYKAFLENLTPREWKVQQREIKQARKEKRRLQFISSHMAEVNERFAEEEERLAAPPPDPPERRSRVGRKGRGDEDEQAQRERERLKKFKQLERRKTEEERRIAESYVDESSEEELELYFKEPGQLMDTFTELEGKNLFLIQSSQETEQLLDELSHSFDHNRKDMSTKVQQLNQNMRTLKANIAQEEQNRDQLRKSLVEKAGTEAQDKKLLDLLHKVRDVYVKCGLSDDHDPNILSMLGQIESRLEELVEGLDDAFNQDSALVMRQEKLKDKDRRDRVRLLKMKEQQDKQEERLKNSLLRSQLPVFKKSGKQVMFRSPPLHRERKVVVDSTEDEMNAADHRIFGLYIDRKTQMPQTEAPVFEDVRRKPATHAVETSGSDGNFMATTGMSAFGIGAEGEAIVNQGVVSGG